MPFLREQDFICKELCPGVSIRAASGERMTVCFFSLSPHAELKEHKHPHEQLGIVLEGAFEITIGTEKKIVKTGDTYIVPPNVPHRVVVGDAPARVVDVFSPPREDYS